MPSKELDQEVAGLPVSFDTANKILHKELLKPEFQVKETHRSIFSVIWHWVVRLFHFNDIHIHFGHIPWLIFEWSSGILVCAILGIGVVLWLRRPRDGRDIVYVASNKHPGARPALDEAKDAISRGVPAEVLIHLVRACVEYALQRHWVHNLKPGKTIRLLEREIAGCGDASFCALFGDVRRAAEKVQFAKREITLSTCVKLLARIEAVYREDRP